MPKTHMYTAKNFANGKHKHIYQVWANMKQRCMNPNNSRYPDYGGRGITVCDRWLSFENFLADMGVPPPKHTLDRIDNDKGYSKDNCRWTTASIQNKNSRRAKHFTVGKQTMCISDWCRTTGISYGLYKARIKRGWSQERALTTPPNNTGKKKALTTRPTQGDLHGTL